MQTTRHDYVRHNVERQQGHQPDAYKQPEGEMDTMTSYNREFVGESKLWDIFINCLKKIA